jgi:hypothetical protein
VEPRRLAAVACAAVLLGAGCADEAVRRHARNPAAVVDGSGYEPRIDPADFLGEIDNPYLPLPVGRTLVYEGVSDGQRERIEVTVTDRTREVMGVTTIVVRDRAFVEGALVEDTFDWFAQDRWGNVWYFGEETAEYEDGEVVSRAGSWEAGVDGAHPGVVMLADPRVGDRYRQEFYEGEAEDMARVRATGVSIAVPAGSFQDVLVTEDWTPLEPDVLEHKIYAPEVGVVLERVMEGGSGVLRLVEIRDAAAG